MTTCYSIDSADGTQITTGIAPHDEVEAIIEERGNGLASPGEYVACDGDVYRVVRTIGPIQTGRSPGAPNWVRAMVVEADWSDIDDDNEPACTARIVTE